MNSDVFLFPVSKEQSGKEGGTQTAFLSVGSEGPRWTNIRKYSLSGKIYEEFPDSDQVKFFYVLQGEGTLTSGEPHSLLRKGSSIFLKGGESFQLARISDAPIVFLRIAINRDSSFPQEEK
jgi:hypothetical protein